MEEKEKHRHSGSAEGKAEGERVGAGVMGRRDHGLAFDRAGGGVRASAGKRI